ncbi:SUMF1/EgtB/PvdO family nonheme iron enzyme [Bernardetia sp. MNP-M8]|uniref:SUMF1/EgtB/PvdO family nonheme iron enzyme n=1 Tax=Bernardetia sp. MNP-M8 TaxID=3127470 RepID=UPI0030D2BB6E
MKNILFVVFLFLPFVSYSQVVSHSLEDSILTVFMKSDTTNKLSDFQSKEAIQRDTIIIKYPPKSLNFIFLDVDSLECSNIDITQARGRRVIGTVSSTSDKLYFTTERIIWDKDNLYIFKEDKVISSLFILNEVDIKKAIQIKEQEIKDSLNRISAIEYHQRRFEKLKEPQENLTEKDKKNIDKIYSKIKLPDGKKKKIGNHKLIDKTEIANIHWIEYLHFLLEDSLGKGYVVSLPDSTVWNKLHNSYELDYHYLRHPVYKDFPVVGITYEQAQHYCIWRANMVNDFLRERNIDKDYEVIVYYRLPTEEEWEYVATKYILNKKSKEHVAEMTSEKGIAKGGSFAHTLEECAADRVQVYDSPQAWLGFRCVGEVVVRKKETE